MTFRTLNRSLVTRAMAFLPANFQRYAIPLRHT